MPIIKLYECLSCDKPLDDNKIFHYCDKCRRPQHALCAGLSRHEITALKSSTADKKVAFICTLCDRNSSDIASLCSMLDNLKKEFEDFKLNHKCSSPETNNIVKDDIVEAAIQEIHERDNRAKNIILFNLCEAECQDDKSKVKELLTSLCPNILVPDFRVFRLGKQVTGKTRPLKICFPSRELAAAAMIGFKKHPAPKIQNGDVKVSRDKTFMERNTLAKLHKELKLRQENGEEKLTIRYIRGTPMIVTQKN